LELKKLHKEAFDRIKDIIIEYDFYLAGGTAVYYYLNHRESEDLDFFTKVKFNEDILQEKLSSFPITYKSEGTIYAEISEIKVSFFYYPYELMFELNKIDSLSIASLKDILPMKVNAIINRGSKKDFIDIYFIMKHLNLNSKEVMNVCLKKFKNMNEMIFLKSLTYFEDADKELEPKMIKDISWEDIKSYIKDEFLRNIFK
jgi:hypothetical protein